MEEGERRGREGEKGKRRERRERKERGVDYEKAQKKKLKISGFFGPFFFFLCFRFQ